MNNIITEQRSYPSGHVYWVAYLSTHPGNYSVGNSEDQAEAYLREAVALRPDIFG